MYSRIIVPLDGSELAEQVLPYVKTIAGKLNIPVKLLRFYSAPAAEEADPDHGRYLHQMEAALSDQAFDYLHAVSVGTCTEGLVTKSEVASGNPAAGIVAEASNDDNALVAMTTHGRSGLGRWVMGSVTDKVLHSVNNPLLVVRAREGEGLENIRPLKNMIVPLDGSPVAEQVLPHVVTLAKALSLDVKLVRARPSMHEYQNYMESHPMGGSATVYTGPYEEFAADVDARAMDYLHEVRLNLQKQGMWSVDQGLIKEHAAEAIVDSVRGIPDSMVAMTTHGRSGISRWVLGSVADKVVRHSGAPVLVVRASNLERDNP